MYIDKMQYFNPKSMQLIDWGTYRYQTAAF